MWYGLIGFTLTFAFGWATSLLWKSDRVVEKRLLAFQGKRSKKENYDEIEVSVGLTVAMPKRGPPQNPKPKRHCFLLFFNLSETSSLLPVRLTVFLVPL